MMRRIALFVCAAVVVMLVLGGGCGNDKPSGPKITGTPADLLSPWAPSIPTGGAGFNSNYDLMEFTDESNGYFRENFKYRIEQSGTLLKLLWLYDNDGWEYADEYTRTQGSGDTIEGAWINPYGTVTFNTDGSYEWIYYYYWGNNMSVTKPVYIDRGRYTASGGVLKTASPFTYTATNTELTMHFNRWVYFELANDTLIFAGNEYTHTTGSPGGLQGTWEYNESDLKNVMEITADEITGTEYYYEDFNNSWNIDFKWAGSYSVNGDIIEINHTMNFFYRVTKAGLDLTFADEYELVDFTIVGDTLFADGEMDMTRTKGLGDTIIGTWECYDSIDDIKIICTFDNDGYLTQTLIFDYNGPASAAITMRTMYEVIGGTLKIYHTMFLKRVK
jgi:hypothetical protein